MIIARSHHGMIRDSLAANNIAAHKYRKDASFQVEDLFTTPGIAELSWQSSQRHLQFYSMVGEMCRSFDPPSHVVILRQEIQKGCLWHQSATQLRRNLMKGPPRLPRYCWAAEQQQQPRLFVEWLMREKGIFGVDGRRVLTISKASPMARAHARLSGGGRTTDPQNGKL